MEKDRETSRTTHWITSSFVKLCEWRSSCSRQAETFWASHIMRPPIPARNSAQKKMKQKKNYTIEWQRKSKFVVELEIELSSCLGTHRTHRQNAMFTPWTNGWHRTQTPDYEAYKRFMILMHTNRSTHKSLARFGSTMWQLVQVAPVALNSNSNSHINSILNEHRKMWR